MALSREQKKRVLDGYGERLARGQVLVWAKYGGLTVEQFQRLRGALRATGCEAVVIKNTLMRIALERAGLSVDTESLVGPLVVSFIYGEIAPSTKALLDFAREFPEQLQVVGGLIGGKLANAPQVSSLATLPSREVLLAQVVGGVQAPISGFVNTLAAVIRGFVNVLQARSEQLESPSV